MQALRRSVNRLVPHVRRMGTAAEEGLTQEKIWAPCFPKPNPTAAEVKKAVSKEMLGFMILGPAGAAFMFYDFVVGLEEEHHVVIPPYPWMRIRRSPGMPWGDDGLFEGNPRVAKVWPPEDGAPAHGHH